MEPQNTLLQGEDCRAGHTEATEWNSTAADEDESLARERLEEAYEFAGHVEAITQAPPPHEKDGSPMAFDVEVRVLDVYMKLRPLAETPEAKRKTSARH